MQKSYSKNETGKRLVNKKEYLKAVEIAKNDHLTFEEAFDKLGKDLEKASKVITDELSKLPNFAALASIGLGKVEMANMLNKVKTIKGVKTHSTMITLDEKINDTFQYKISKDKIEERLFYKLSKIEEKAKVVLEFENNVLVDVTEVTPVQNLSNKQKMVFTKPEGMSGNHYIPPSHRKVLNACAKRQTKGKNSIVHLVGGSGYGKTSTAQSVAERLQIPVFTLDCSTIIGNTEWYVRPELKNGNTTFDLTELSENIIAGNRVIILDEANRVPTWVSNTLLPILDHRQETEVYGQKIKAGNGLMFFLTSNRGYEYSGTNELDFALQGRIQGTLKVEAHPVEIEGYIVSENYPDLDHDDIYTVVKIMNELRRIEDFPVNVSTRTSLYMADWMDNGLTIEEAFEITVLNITPLEFLKKPQEIIKQYTF